MIPVVHDAVQERIDPVEAGAPNALFLELLRVADGEGEEGAHVVVHDPHLNALCRLLLEDRKDSVPHLSGLNREVLHEDELLCALQGLEHRRIPLLAAGIVGIGRIAVDGEVLTGGDVLHLSRIVCRSLSCALQDGAVLLIVFHGPLCLGDDVPVQPARAGGDPLEEGVDQETADGGGHDEHDPEKVTGQVPACRGKVERHDDGKKVQDGLDPGEGGLQSLVEGKDKEQLDQDCKDRERCPAEEVADDVHNRFQKSYHMFSPLSA